MDDIVLTDVNFEEIIGHMKTTDRPFTNSECLFVEYHDIVKAPWYILLTVLPQNKKANEVLKISELLEGMDSDALFEWYCNRQNRNFLLDIARLPCNQFDYDKLLSMMMEGNEIFYRVDTTLNAVPMIKKALIGKQAKSVIIYNETDNPFIRDDIKRLFGNRGSIKFLHGNFADVVKKNIPIDTTFILSDFNKVVTLADIGHLSYSSIVLPYDFAYNFIFSENGEKMPVVDFTYLGKDSMFKLNFFNSCYQ